MSMCRKIGYKVVNVIHPTVPPSPPSLNQSYISPAPSSVVSASPEQNRNQSAGAARYGGGVGKPPYVNGPQMMQKP